MARTKIDNDAILNDMERVRRYVARINGKDAEKYDLTREEYLEYGLVGIATIYRRWGSWKKALELSRKTKGTHFKKLIEFELRRESKENDGKPLSRRASRFGKAAESTYGTWGKAKEAAGIA